jgi:hypothetical protein
MRCGSESDAYSLSIVQDLFSAQLTLCRLLEQTAAAAAAAFSQLHESG